MAGTDGVIVSSTGKTFILVSVISAGLIGNIGGGIGVLGSGRVVVAVLGRGSVDYVRG